MVGVRLVMDGHADGERARADKEHEARPRRDYSIIQGILLWTHATLTNLPAGTVCLAASSMRYIKHVKGNSVRSKDSAICLQSVVVSICFHHVST